MALIVFFGLGGGCDDADRGKEGFAEAACGIVGEVALLIEFWGGMDDNESVLYSGGCQAENCSLSEAVQVTSLLAALADASNPARAPTAVSLCLCVGLDTVDTGWGKAEARDTVGLCGGFVNALSVAEEES